MVPATSGLRCKGRMRWKRAFVNLLARTLDYPLRVQVPALAPSNALCSRTDSHFVGFVLSSDGVVVHALTLT